MDAAGAKKLSWRIEQQENWRQAEAVRDGRQPGVDPDSDTLERVEGDIRLYRARATHGGIAYMCKRLVGGVWELGMLEEPWQEAPDAPPYGEIASVA